MGKVIWSKVAKDDLKQIYKYISRDSKYYADQVVEKIIGKTEHLENYPHMGRVVPEINNESIRELLVYSYRLVYQISQDGEIQVLALIHSKKQFPTTLEI